MRLYDTARGAGRPLRAGSVVTMYSCGITPYDAAHLGPRRRLPHLRHPAAPAARRRPRDALRAQRHRRRRRHPAQGPRARRALPRPGRRGDGAASTPTWRRSTSCPVYSEPRATSAIPDILVADRRRRSRAATPTSPAGRSTSTSRPSRRFGQLSHLDRAEMLVLAAEHGGQPRRPQQARPARLRAVAALAARRAVVGVALGTGATRLAHRVLGAGAARARRDHRRPRRRAATSSSRTTSARRPSPSRSPARRSSATGCTSGLVGLDGTKMSKSLGNLVFVGDLLKEWDPTAVRLALLAHHYRHRLGVAARTDAEPRPTPGALALGRGRRTDVTGRRRSLDEVRDARSTTTSTRPAALRALDDGGRRRAVRSSPGPRCSASTC